VSVERFKGQRSARKKLRLRGSPDFAAAHPKTARHWFKRSPFRLLRALLLPICLLLVSVSFHLNDKRDEPKLSFNDTESSATPLTQSIAPLRQSLAPLTQASDGAQEPQANPRPYPRLRFSRILEPGTFMHPHWGRQRDMAFHLDDIAGLLDAASRRRALPSDRLAAVSIPRKKHPGSHGADAQDRIVIAIDPGHGGLDPGSVATNGLLEKELNLDIANRLRDMLAKDPSIEIILTREDDVRLTRHERVEAIRDSQADLMLSVHFNALPQKDINLVETYFAAPANIEESLALLSEQQEISDQDYLKASREESLEFAFTKGSARLARVLHESVYAAVSSANSKTVDAGLKNDTLYVLTRSFTPAILMEISCLSNLQEAERLQSNGYRDRIAKALADGLRIYRKSLIESPLADIGV